MRKLSTTILFLVIGLVLLPPPPASVKGERTKGDAPSAAPAPAVRLVFDTSFITAGTNFDSRWDVSQLQAGRASIKTESGELIYTWTVPNTIDSGGSPMTLTVKAIARKRTNLSGVIQVSGEVDFKEAITTVNAFSENEVPKSAPLTVTMVPRTYSEGYYPIVRLRMEGGAQGLNVDLRFSVELASTGGGLKMEYDTNRAGQDYQNFNLPQARPELCQAQCGADRKCRAFTYVKPGLQGPSARCWLKSGVPPASRNSCCVSGFKG